MGVPSHVNGGKSSRGGQTRFPFLRGPSKTRLRVDPLDRATDLTRAPPGPDQAGSVRQADPFPPGVGGRMDDRQEDTMSTHAYLSHEGRSTSGVLTGTFRRAPRLVDDEHSNRAVNQAVARAKQGDR